MESIQCVNISQKKCVCQIIDWSLTIRVYIIGKQTFICFPKHTFQQYSIRGRQNMCVGRLITNSLRSANGFKSNIYRLHKRYLQKVDVQSIIGVRSVTQDAWAGGPRHHHGARSSYQDCPNHNASSAKCATALASAAQHVTWLVSLSLIFRWVTQIIGGTIRPFTHLIHSWHNIYPKLGYQ